MQPGFRGQQDPTPRKARPNSRTWKYPAHPGPRQTVAAELTGGQKTRLNAL